MMKRITPAISIFLLWTFLGTLSKVVFMLTFRSMLDGASAADCLAVLWHGLLLDFAMAGYLTLFPLLLLLVGQWGGGRPLRFVWHGYFLLASLLTSVGYVSNLALYSYWGFPLDDTPLLYLRTSPSDAMASVTTLQLVGALLATVVTAAGIWLAFRMTVRNPFPDARTPQPMRVRVLNSFVLLLLAAFLVIPIRGGFGTGTNHTGSVYFSTNIRLNHAAVNPLFSFMESVMHKEDIGSRYRFMPDAEAARLFSGLSHTALRPDTIRTVSRPNVIMICLESFSKYLMEEKGHLRNVVPNLERLCREGTYFTNIYANSFRTDRALVSVLSALPAQPTMSIMDMPRKSTSLPSIARTLAANGYSTTFYYGGDTNYSNMRSYFMGTGFQTIISEYEFPARARTSKWGVPDGPVYDRMLSDINAHQDSQPFFRFIMTESSHEPFDVPETGIRPEPELNAFAYADRCLGRFIDALRQSPAWKNTIVVIVPDHLGAYPLTIDDYKLWRYEIPLVMLGGGLPSDMPRTVDTIGGQIDIAATILGLLGINHDDYLYSKDLLDAAAPHFAFFTMPDAMGMVTADGMMIYDNISGTVVNSHGTSTDSLLLNAKSYLQTLYDDIDAR